MSRLATDVRVANLLLAVFQRYVPTITKSKDLIAKRFVDQDANRSRVFRAIND